MMPAVPFTFSHGKKFVVSEQAVETACQTANSEGKNYTFQIKAGFSAQIEHSRRKPIAGIEKRFRQPQRRRADAHHQHLFTLWSLHHKHNQPNQQQDQAPEKIGILHVHYRLPPDSASLASGGITVAAIVAVARVISTNAIMP